jgi:hypothetical protein
LFGSGAKVPAEAALGAVDTAAESTTATAQHTADMSGAAIARYQSFAHESAGELSQAAHTDTALQAHVATAATLTQTGAQRLEAIAAQTRATAQGAPTATTPAAQRSIIAALHSQRTQAADVVNTTKQQASGQPTKSGVLDIRSTTRARTLPAMVRVRRTPYPLRRRRRSRQSPPAPSSGV